MTNIRYIVKSAIKQGEYLKEEYNEKDCDVWNYYSATSKNKAKQWAEANNIKNYFIEKIRI